MPYSEYNHIISLSGEQVFKDEMKGFLISDKSVLISLKSSFVDPIENGMCPFTEITGRYKPSCEMDFMESTMKNAFVSLARKNNLYHYHFGYPFYKDEDPDSKYRGKVSDGIIHTRLIINEKEKTIEHRIIKICVSHPTPFTVPYERVNY